MASLSLCGISSIPPSAAWSAMLLARKGRICPSDRQETARGGFQILP
ncbi:hypothetical protein HMPREF9141_1014 [Prevotella multiformis DSM 16608]|uniref:Uncharacterized protein n=1 Tax=Prevotella multiformis DSM 16608 TaxID=888743 RepID=F0F5Z8_9BACT|nr:hypothetical protein HMPREF9141_1014 [Prevotella multiformis DSM 16608]